MPRQAGLMSAGWLQQFQPSYLVIPSCERRSLSHKPLGELPFYLTGQTDTIFKRITGKVNRMKKIDVVGKLFLKGPVGKYFRLFWS